MSEDQNQPQIDMIALMVGVHKELERLKKGLAGISTSNYELYHRYQRDLTAVQKRLCQVKSVHDALQEVQPATSVDSNGERISCPYCGQLQAVESSPTQQCVRCCRDFDTSGVVEASQEKEPEEGEGNDPVDNSEGNDGGSSEQSSTTEETQETTEGDTGSSDTPATEQESSDKPANPNTVRGEPGASSGSAGKKSLSGITKKK